MTGIYLCPCTKETEHSIGRALAEYAVRVISGERHTLSHDARGKPCFDGGWHVSISHSHGLCLAVISHRAIGADIEKTGGDPEKLLKLAARFFAPDELAYVKESPEDRFYEIWTAKESFVKYTGEGFSRTFPSFSVFDQPLVFSHFIHGDHAVTICAESAVSAKIIEKNEWEL
ncbi:MAG: 4'-phosphopantetheinyl transferase superfamily protein [Ruminococcaceae bacterium]|nr:4'-phosphopantetheinyl transferase superfamily protein [Oscillospiraceae bacterium]